jgi:hypothetical protein
MLFCIGGDGIPMVQIKCGFCPWVFKGQIYILDPERKQIGLLPFSLRVCLHVHGFKQSMCENC